MEDELIGAAGHGSAVEQWLVEAAVVIGDHALDVRVISAFDAVKIDMHACCRLAGHGVKNMGCELAACHLSFFLSISLGSQSWSGVGPGPIVDKAVPGSKEIAGWLDIMRNALLTLASLALVLLALEVVARYYHDSIVPRRSRVVPIEIGRYDHRYGWSLVPGNEAASSAVGEAIRYRINTLGLRGGEVTRERPADRYRVLLIGASRAFGFGANEEDHVPKLLEAYLDGVEVLNGGVSGYGIDQMLLRFETEGRLLEPDLVILYLPHFGSHRHMHGERFSKRKPRFTLEDGELKLVNELPDLGLQTEPFWPVPWMAWLEERSMLAQLMSHVVVLRIQDRSDRWSNSTRYKDDVRRDRVNAKDPEFVEAMRLLAEALLVRLAKAVEDAGAELLVVTEMRDLELRAKKAGIATLYLYHVLNNPYFELPDGLGHLSRKGNTVLTAKIFEEILARKWLCDRHPAHYRC